MKRLALQTLTWVIWRIGFAAAGSESRNLRSGICAALHVSSAPRVRTSTRASATVPSLRAGCATHRVRASTR